MDSTSIFHDERVRYQPRLPHKLQQLNLLKTREERVDGKEDPTIRPLFPHTYGAPSISFEEGRSTTSPLRVGVVLSGGQAPGGHNVIVGIFDALKKLHSHSVLYGFLGGPGGILSGKYKELKEELLARYRNTGGFDCIGSGRTKIETEEQLLVALKQVEALKLNGLIIIGGDDSNTNAALLAEFFLARGCTTHVIGVPKTIDGDLKNACVEVSFGFDTAAKIYSEMIGNIARDALSSQKYYHFIKLMGRTASHLTLECALQTHPNCALIGEEVSEKKMTLQEVVGQIADTIEARSRLGRNYGVVLIPEGLIESIGEMQRLIQELNAHLADKTPQEALTHLSKETKKTFAFLPSDIQQQLLFDRDPHGNVRVSQIDTEKLVIALVKEELKKRPNYKGVFHPLAHFLGYEGRSGYPSNFDANYCYGLGHVAALLIARGCTGYISALQGLTRPPEEWEPMGFPLTALLVMEERKGKKRPVIGKALVDLQGLPFQEFEKNRERWAVEDAFSFPGPIQFFGSSTLTDTISQTLLLEQRIKK